MTLSRGWKARQDAAKARAAERAAGFNIATTPKAQARHAIIEAQAEEARRHAEERERLYRETVTECPCCAGKGHVIVIEGAAIIEAIERYRNVGWAPSKETIGRLLAKAFVVDREGNRTAEAVPTTETRADPVPPITASTDDTTEEDDALAEIGIKPKRRKR